MTAKCLHGDGVGAFSAVLVSCPHLYPHIDVKGTKFTSERSSVPARSYDELGTVGGAMQGE